MVMISLQQKVQNRQLPARQYENVDKRYDIFESENLSFFADQFLIYIVIFILART